MKQVIAFWNISPFEKDFYQGQLLGTVTVDGDEMVASSATNDFPLEKFVEDEESAEDFLKMYSDYASVAGFGSRLLLEDEEPKDLVYNKYVVTQPIPGGGVKVKSWTIDEKGVWHKDAEES